MLREYSIDVLRASCLALNAPDAIAGLGSLKRGETAKVYDAESEHSCQSAREEQAMIEYIKTGNIKLLFCFAFYLVWWLVGFNPWRPIRGLRSGWLLIPAIILGILALCDIGQGLDFSFGLVPGIAVVPGGVASYVVLLIVTGRWLHRPVTSELFIIVLWATVALLEINTLAALGSISPGLAWALAAFCLASTAASLVCYQLFYGLDDIPAFVDGAIPLVLAGLMTGCITLFCAP